MHHLVGMNETYDATHKEVHQILCSKQVKEICITPKILQTIFWLNMRKSRIWLTIQSTKFWILNQKKITSLCLITYSKNRVIKLFQILDKLVCLALMCRSMGHRQQRMAYFTKPLKVDWDMIFCRLKLQLQIWIMKFEIRSPWSQLTL